MSDVFISYSRKDTEFVRRLHDALQASGRDSWVDWEDIPPTAEWMEEIHRAIEGAHTFVFVITPHSLQSGICRAEVEYASQRGKRLVPIVQRHVDAAEVPEPLAKLNWLFFTDDDDFGRTYQELLRALDTDLEHVRAHTRILVRAQLWSRREEEASFLLRGRDLEDAERWLQASQGKEPAPISLQANYILNGRRAETRRQRRTLLGVVAALVVSILLALLALYQRNLAEAARVQAETQRRLAVARALATQSELAVDDTTDGLVVGTLLAVESLKSAKTEEGVTSWKRRMQLLSKPPVVESAALGQTTGGSFDQSGALWAAGAAEGIVTVGETESGRAVAQWQALESAVHSLSFSPNSELLAAGGDGVLAVWDFRARTKIAEFQPNDSRLDTFGTVRDLAFSRDGKKLFAAAEGYGIEVISTEAWKVQEPLPIEESRSFALALHPKLNYLAVGGFGWTLLDLERRKALPVPDFRREEVDTLRFSAEGYELASADLAVRVWDLDLENGESFEIQPADRLITSDERILALAFSKNGRYLVVAWESGAVRVLETKTGAEVQRIPESAPVSGVAFTPNDQKIMTMGSRFRQWQALSKDEVHSVRLSQSIKESYFIANGKWLVVTSDEGTIRILDPNGLREERTVQAGRGIVTAVSPDGQWLAHVEQKAVTILDTLDLARVTYRELEGAPKSVKLLFDPGSRFLVATGRGIAAIYDFVASEWTDLMKQGSRQGWNPVFIHNGEWLVLMGGGVTRMFRSGSWKAVPEMQGNLRAMSADGSQVCTHTPVVRGGQPPMLSIWQVPTGEKLAWGPEPGYEEYAGSDADSLSGGNVELLRQCADWEAIGPEEGADRAPESPRWRVESQEDLLRVFPLQVKDMIEEACRRLPRDLTEEEWKTYLPEEEYRLTCPNLEIGGPESRPAK